MALVSRLCITVLTFLALVPVYGYQGEDGSPEEVIHPEGEVQATQEAEVTGAGVSVRFYSGRPYYYRERHGYYRPYYTTYPRQYRNRYRRPGEPRYNYRYYRYSHQVPYGTHYYGS